MGYKYSLGGEAGGYRCNIRMYLFALYNGSLVNQLSIVVDWIDEICHLATLGGFPFSHSVRGNLDEVILPLHQLKAVNPSASKVNSSEKYIQVISVDSHEFWFMGFVNYDGAVINLREALEGRSSQTM